MEKVDIVVIGAGPFGLCVSACLARWGYSIKHIDNRPEPTPTGRADGIQPRVLDLFKDMGLKRKIMAHVPARVYEVAFWDPGPDGIRRSGTWASCPKFIDARYPFTALLHQGHIERVWIEDIEKHGARIQRPWTITNFANNGQDPAYPVRVELAHVDGNEAQIVRCKYLLSGEGARSFVRDQLNIHVKHFDKISHVWGVMDGVVRTNFPDIKMKCTIHSDAGSIMVIPREDNMIRLYVQVASSTDEDFDTSKTATEQQVMDHARAIMKPYHITWDRVEWYSVYPIAQGIAEHYTLDERVFMGGDACHTHSPKAGQGMNTAFIDAVNLAWKIHHVEQGFADRCVLSTYEGERRAVAEELLAFDSHYARLFSTRLPSAGEVGAANQHESARKTDAPEENEFIKAYKASAEFTSGYGVKYHSNVYNWSPDHPVNAGSVLSVHNGGTKLRPGRIFTPATVTRVVDANVRHLEHEIPFNGSFRLYLFAGEPAETAAPLADFCSALKHRRSFLSRYARRDLDADLYHERHNPHSHLFSFCVVFNAKRAEIDIDKLLPEPLIKYRDCVYADDIWDQRVPEAAAAAHAKMGFDPRRGGLVVVRPDGYVSLVLKFNGAATVDALDQYFGSFAVKHTGTDEPKL